MSVTMSDVIQHTKDELMLANLANIWPIECPPRLAPHYLMYMGEDLKIFQKRMIGESYIQNLHSRKKVAEILEKSWASEHLLVNSEFDELQMETGLSSEIILKWFDWKNRQQGVETVLSGLIENHSYLKGDIINSLSSLFRISQKALEVLCVKIRADNMIFKIDESQLETSLMKEYLLHRHESNKFSSIEKISSSFELSAEDVVEIFNCWSTIDLDEDSADIKNVPLPPQLDTITEEKPSSQFHLDFEQSKENKKLMNMMKTNDSKKGADPDEASSSSSEVRAEEFPVS